MRSTGPARSVLIVTAILLGVVELAPSVTLAGDSQVLKWGNDAELIEGDWQNSSVYPEGIELSPGVGAGWAVWNFTIDPLPRTYYLSIRAHSSDESTLGDGADLYIYNVLTGVYDFIMKFNKGEDVTSVSAVIPMYYVEWTGRVLVYIFADWLDDTNIDYIRLDWGFDDSPPVNPWWHDSEPSVDCFTSDNVIQVQWFGAFDYDNSVGGYSILWSNESSAMPDTVIDTVLPSAISPVLEDGIWYLHVRCVDTVGNWNDTSYVIGPFLVDSCAPVLIILTPYDESISDSDDVTVSWQADDGCSGVVRYEISVDGGAWKDVGLSTSCVLTNLSNSYHTVWVRAYDGAGNSVVMIVDFAVDYDTVTIEELFIWFVLPLLFFIAIAIVVAALMLGRRKKRLEAFEVEEESDSYDD